MFNEIERTNRFNHIETKEDLLFVLNVSLKKYNYLVYQKRNPYKTFDITKKQGGTRKISSPCFELKKIQRELNIILNNNYNFNNEIVQGFLKGNSIKSNANIHKNATYILNIDIKNFFDTIHFGRVRGMFMKPPFEFSNYIATNLAKVTCYEKKLPQGAPTSPTISNIICYRLDRELAHLCKRNNCRYTRYADDIVISTKMLKFPTKIAKFENNRVILSDKIINIFKREGFLINHNKLKFCSKNVRQEVTGLIVNKKVNVKKVYLKKLRALLNNSKKFGFYLAGAKYFENIIHLNFNNKVLIQKKFIKVLKGKIEFLKMIRGIEDKVYIKYASIFNELVNKEIFDVDYGIEIQEFIENRTFPLISYDEMVQGTCFLAENYGLITSTHVLINKDAFINEYFHKEALNKKTFSFNSVGTKPFYLLDHYNTYFNINPVVNEANIKSDILIFPKVNAKKNFRINYNYKPKKGEKVYLAGYGQFKDFNSTSINYIEAQITGNDVFLGRTIYCISERIYHGMSGGPVLNKDREVIGIIYVGLNMEDNTLGKHNGFILLSETNINLNI